MFSVGINFYLIPTINGDVKYQPKQVSSYGMINWKRGRPVCSTSISIICGQNFLEENSNFLQLAVDIS